METRPVPSAPLADCIEDMILTGAVAPGARLDEASLGRRFGVSRTPVREALRTLAGSGLVEIRPNRGAVAAAVTPERRVEMFDVMAELEALCARRAALAAGPVARARLDALHEACEAAVARDDADAYYYVNEGFHEAIDGATANAFLSEQTRALRRRLKPFRRLQLRAPGRLAASVAEHAAILAAIGARDADAADAAMRAHVVVQGVRFDDVAPTMTPTGPVAARG